MPSGVDWSGDGKFFGASSPTSTSEPVCSASTGTKTSSDWSVRAAILSRITRRPPLDQHQQLVHLANQLLPRRIDQPAGLRILFVTLDAADEHGLDPSGRHLGRQQRLAGMDRLELFQEVLRLF